jgi:Asp-tRNA(Asn)/Glu-tRNA(Gln) amidotransferase C subunit
MVGQLDKAETGDWSNRWLTRWPARCSACARTPSVRRTERELYQRNAPQVEAGLYLVPKVIE